MGDPMSAIMFGLLNAVGSSLGSQQAGQSSGSTRFDMSMLPAFNASIGENDAAMARLAEVIRGLQSQREQALATNLDNQMSAVRGIGDQSLQDINQRYNSQQGVVNQSLSNRGLYNSSVMPGMKSLVERERNNALGQERQRQSQYFGGLLGQRAQLMDNVQESGNQAITQSAMQSANLRSLIPQAIASSRVSSEKSKGIKGILSGLFR